MFIVVTRFTVVTMLNVVIMFIVVPRFTVVTMFIVVIMFIDDTMITIQGRLEFLLQFILTSVREHLKKKFHICFQAKFRILVSIITK